MSGVVVGLRRHGESSRTQDLHGVVPHGLPSLAGHNAAVDACVLLLGIQDLQPMATWGKGGLLRGSLLTAEAVYPRAAHEDILKDLLTTCKPAWRASNALLEPNFQAYKNPCGLTDAAEKLLAITR